MCAKCRLSFPDNVSRILMIQLVQMELFTEDHSMEMRTVIVLCAVKRIASVHGACGWAGVCYVCIGSRYQKVKMLGNSCNVMIIVI